MPDCLRSHLKLGLIMSFTMLENLFGTLINYLIESLSLVKTQNMIYNRLNVKKKIQTALNKASLFQLSFYDTFQNADNLVKNFEILCFRFFLKYDTQ